MNRVAVVGLGTMGAGMVATLARAGLTVSAYDVSAEQRAGASAAIAAAAQVLDALGMPDNNTGDTAPRIAESLADCVAGAELVIENVPEKLALKIEVLQAVDALVSETCVLASDTSGIPITKLQAGVSHPGRVVGMHWSNPPHIIPIIEVVAGQQTSPETVSWMVETVTGRNMLPVVVKKDVPGFVENRILYAIMREAVDLVEQGVIDAEGLDTCVSWGIGYKLAVVGPMALLDMAGLDIYQAVGSYLNEDLCARKDVSAMIAEKTGRGELGMKTGKGMFSYTPEQLAELRAARAKKLVAVRRVLES